MTEAAQSTQDRINAISAMIQPACEELKQDDKFKEFLNTMGKFHNYSVNNTILIYSQRPDASYVASFNSWKNNFDRQVLQGAHGIQIIQPAPYKKLVMIEKQDANGNKVIGADGKPVMEEQEKIIQSYKVGYVFDISDTKGTPLPSLVETLYKDVDNFEEVKSILETVSPVPITYQEIKGGANGYYDLTTKDIHIKSDLPELQTIKTMIHEIAHAHLHDRDTGTDKEVNQREKEIEAESVAYTVCSYYGLDTSDYSFGYIVGWSKDMALDEFKDCLDKIRETSGTIIESIDKELLNRRLREDIPELAFKIPDGYFYIQNVYDGNYDYSIADRFGNLVDGGQVESDGKSLMDITKEILKDYGKDFSVATIFDPQTVVDKMEHAEEIRNEKFLAESVKFHHGIR